MNKEPSTFRYEKCAYPIGPAGEVEVGTIRTVPENYYVASVSRNGSLLFRGLEVMTRDLPRNVVHSWWQHYQSGERKRVLIWHGVVTEVECGTATHPHAFAYNGTIPNTGSKRCIYCGARDDERVRERHPKFFKSAANGARPYLGWEVVDTAHDIAGDGTDIKYSVLRDPRGGLVVVAELATDRNLYVTNSIDPERYVGFMTAPDPYGGADLIHRPTDFAWGKITDILESIDHCVCGHVKSEHMHDYGRWTTCTICACSQFNPRPAPAPGPTKRQLKAAARAGLDPRGFATKAEAGMKTRLHKETVEHYDRVFTEAQIDAYCVQYHIGMSGDKKTKIRRLMADPRTAPLFRTKTK